MSTTTFEHSPSSLEEKLATYWKLVDERDQMLSRIAKAKNEKDSVNERIFQRVMADYEGLLNDTTAQLEPLKAEMDALRQQTDQDIKQLDAAIQETEDELSEATFRQRVGEYDLTRLTEVKKRLEPRLAEAREVRTQLQNRLRAMDRRRPSREAAPAEASLGTTVAPAAPAPEYARPSYETPQPAAAPAAAKRRQPVDEWDDPLAALSDPAPAARTSESPAAQPASRGRGATAAPAYPNLLIRSGAHAGKIVPLLPMTMSIGREHDNNIELKDPEVARYHARILYENGRFHVEDLDSSTGTWVNGQHQKRRALSEGDVIRIGGTELVVEFA